MKTQAACGKTAEKWVMENDCVLNISMWLKFKAMCNHVFSLRSLVAVMHIEEMCTLGNIVLQTAYWALRMNRSRFYTLRVYMEHLLLEQCLSHKMLAVEDSCYFHRHSECL